MVIQLEIKNYRRLPFFKTKKIQFSMPTTWEEATFQDIEFLFPLLPVHESEAVKTIILSKYLKPKYFDYLGADKQTLFNAIDKLFASPLKKLSFSEIPFKNKRISFLLFGKQFNIWTPFQNKLNVPAAYLGNLTFGEVASGLKQVIIYFNTKGTRLKNLNNAMAIFFRPFETYFFKTGNETIKTESYDLARIAKNTELFEQMADSTKIFFVYYILGTLEALKTAPVLSVLFPKPPKDTDTEKTKTAKATDTQKDPNIWLNFMINIADLGIAGDFDKISDTSFVQVLTIAAKKKRDAIAAERQRIHHSA